MNHKHSFTARVAALLAAVVALVALGAAPALASDGSENPPAFSDVLIRLSERLDIPAAPIVDENGAAAPMIRNKGKVNIVTFWATWCPACYHEMPRLDALQGQLGANRLAVTPVSLDFGDGAMAKVRRYLDRRDLDRLPAYLDFANMNADMLQVYVTPTSFILDKQGRMVAAIEGPVDWTSPDAVAFLRELAAE